MGATHPEVTVYPAPDDLARGAAAIFADLATAAVAARGRFTVALAGGGTPRPVYELLATPAFAARIPWDRVQVFFADERCVPPTDPDSNFRMARTALLDHVPLAAAGIHRMAGEADPAAAARTYEQTLADVFPGEDPPVLDLVLLGLGDDGHTASLFPGTPALQAADRWVVSQEVAVVGGWRLTFTPGLINAARSVIFLVAGAGKAAVVARVLEGEADPQVLPAQLVRPASGPARWLVDAAAGAGLAGR